jgi:glycosyltransferase involved in cell wall biosynthesis
VYPLPRLEASAESSFVAATSPARKLNIVSVCRTLPTPADAAAGTFVANRLVAMSKLADVRVVQPVAYLPGVRPLPDWARAPAHQTQGLRIEPEPMFYVPGVLKHLDGMWLARSAGRKIRQLMRAQRIDAIDAHFGYPDGVGCVRVAQELGIPAFVTIRGSETDFLRKPKIGEQLVTALNTATGVISVSHSLRQLAMDHGVDGQRIRVIPNAVDRNVFKPGSRDEARRRLGIDANARLIVSVGHLISGKRHHVLVRALRGLRARFPTAMLGIIGGAAYDRTYPEYLERIIKEEGVAAKVRMIGRVPQASVNDWLQAADLFALATEREGCCNAVLEALAAGRPVVTTPVGDNAHFVQPGTNGALAPVDDVAAFERAIGDTFERNWDAQAISRGLDVGGWDDVAHRVLEFMQERMDGGVPA